MRNKMNTLVWAFLMLGMCLSLNAISDAFTVNTISEEITEILFTLPEYEFETIEVNDLHFLRVVLTEGESLSETGYPQLPVFSTTIAVPVNSDISVENEVQSRKSRVENVRVYPVQNLERAESSFDYEPSFYQTRNSESVYPEINYTVSSVQTIRDYQVVTVNVYPMRYFPNQKELEVTSEIRIDIKHQTSEIRHSSPFPPQETKQGVVQEGANRYQVSPKLSRAFEPIYESLIANYDQVRAPNPVYQEPSLLIINGGNPTGNQLTALNSLVTWKKQRGFEVTRVSTAQAGLTTTAIKNYLQTAYDTWDNPPEFVLLLGGARSNSSYRIPTYDLDPSNNTMGGSNLVGPGDYPYTHLAGDDQLGDVFIGRLSADNANDLLTLINKVIRYEREPLMAGDAWLGRSLLVGDSASSGISTIMINRYIQSLMTDYDPTHTIITMYGPGPSAVTMKDHMNTGVAIFNHRGIQGINSFNSQIGALTNENKMAHCIWLTCDTGRFNGNTTSYIEQVVKHTNSGGGLAGAITAIGMSTSGTHTAYNNAMDGALFYALYPADMATMGQALLFSKLYLVSAYSGVGTLGAAASVHWMNLLGDPSLYVYKTKPKQFATTLPTSIARGTQGLSLAVVDQSSSPVADVWVTISSADASYISKAFTAEDGMAYLSIDPTQNGPFIITISKAGFAPQRGVLMVTEAPFISVVDYLINDTTGNNDGDINHGETITLTIEVRYQNSDLRQTLPSPSLKGRQQDVKQEVATRSSLIATLSSDSEHITIVQNTYNIGVLATDTTTVIVDAFTFTVSPLIPANTLIPLTIDIADSVNVWTSILLPEVKAAYIDILDMTTNTNHDYVDIGDTTSLYFDFKNIGSYTAYNVSAKLVSKSIYLTVIDSVATIGTLTAGEEASNETEMFKISVDRKIISGMSLAAEIHIYSNDNCLKIAPISITAGHKQITDPTGPCEYGYVICDANDDSADVPIYNWKSIKTIGQNTGMVDNNPMGEEDAVLVQLPFSAWFYGLQYDEITICSNGWFVFGQTAQRDFRNLPLPGPIAPKAMVAPFWTDLAFGPARTGFPGGGGVYTYYDETDNAFIIQWDQVRMITKYSGANSWTVGDSVTFQAIIYNHIYHPSSLGDSPIKFQYHRFLPGVPGDINHPMNYITIGIQDHTEKRGITYVYNNVYTPGSLPLTSGAALMVTTWEGQTTYPDPLMAIAPPFKNFALTEIFTTAQHIFTIENRGLADLVIDNWEIEGSEDFTVTGLETPLILGHREYHSFTVNFSPNIFETQTAVITLTNNTDTPVRTIALSGAAFENLRPPRNLRARVEEYYVQLDWDTPVVREDEEPTRAFIGYKVLQTSQVLVPLTTETTYRDSLRNITQQSIRTYHIRAVYDTGESPNLTISGVVVYPVIVVNALSFAEGFEESVTPPGWRNLSLDGDNRVWQRLTGAANVYAGIGAAASNSTVAGTTSLPPDNWLITPKLQLPESNGLPIYLKYYVSTHNTGGNIFPEHYSIMLNNDGVAIDNFIELFSETVEGPTWYLRYISLDDYAGQAVYIAFRHHNSANIGYAFLKIDEISVVQGDIVSDSDDQLPTLSTGLIGNYPNPFNPTTTISFAIGGTDLRSQTSDLRNVTIDIYNIKGQKVRSLVNKDYASGVYKVIWNGTDDNGRDVSSGIYFYRLKTDDVVQTKKMILMK